MAELASPEAESDSDPTPTSPAWRNLIVGYAEMNPYDLIPNPKNWRLHPETQRLAMIGALDEVGWLAPLIWNRRNGNLIDGHMRRDVAIAKGEGSVPVIVVDASDAEESKALATLDPISAMAVADNQLLSDLLSTIQTEDQAVGALLESLIPVAPGYGPSEREQEDYEDETVQIAEKWAIAPGELWEIPSASSPIPHRLLCGSADSPEDVDRLLHERRATLLATDPPYGVDFEGSKFVGISRTRTVPWEAIEGDTRQGASLADWLTGVWKLWLPYLHDRGAVYCWSGVMEEGFASLQSLKQAGIHIQAEIIWGKDRLSLGQADYQWKHESCWYGFRKGTKHFWYGGRAQTTLWAIDKDAVNDYLHPMQKPVDLFIVPIQNHTKPGEIVLEPFAGSGSQYLAAEELGRTCFGMEIDPTFAAVTLERLHRRGLTPERIA